MLVEWYRAILEIEIIWRKNEDDTTIVILWKHHFNLQLILH